MKSGALCAGSSGSLGVGLLEHSAKIVEMEQEQELEDSNLYWRSNEDFNDEAKDNYLT